MVMRRHTSGQAIADLGRMFSPLDPRSVKHREPRRKTFLSASAQAAALS
jgi:hypothetical protein